MKLIRFFTILSILIYISLYSCSGPTEPSIEENLVLNYSFEKNEEPLFEGWKINNDQQITFTEYVPPNGGKWAVSIGSTWSQTTNILYTVPAIKGSNKYRLSVWSGAPRGGAGAYAEISLKHNNIIKEIKHLDFYEKLPNGYPTLQWNEYKTECKISAVEGDSIIVTLGIKLIDYLGSDTFDLCKLYVLK